MKPKKGMFVIYSDYRYKKHLGIILNTSLVQDRFILHKIVRGKIKITGDVFIRKTRNMIDHWAKPRPLSIWE